MALLLVYVRVLNTLFIPFEYINGHAENKLSGQVADELHRISKRLKSGMNLAS
jgi:hypothetical protein